MPFIFPDFSGFMHDHLSNKFCVSFLYMHCHNLVSPPLLHFTAQFFFLLFISSVLFLFHGKFRNLFCLILMSFFFSFPSAAALISTTFPLFPHTVFCSSFSSLKKKPLFLLLFLPYLLSLVLLLLRFLSSPHLPLLILYHWNLLCVCFYVLCLILCLLFCPPISILPSHPPLPPCLSSTLPPPTKT